MLFQAGKISAEEAIDKSKNPGFMVDKMHRNGLAVPGNADDALLAEADDSDKGGDDGDAAGTGAKNKPNAPGGNGGAQSEAEKQAQQAANRARLQALAGKK
jgi:hypothetical protein